MKLPFQVGDTATYQRQITADDIAAFARLSGDHNPLHADPDFARRTRFGRPIAHGMLTAALISAVLGTRLPGPGGIYLSQELRFLAPVYPGDRITARVEVLAVREDKPILHLRTTCTNQDGVTVVDGTAVVLYEPPA